MSDVSDYSKADLDKIFTYHAPKENQPARYELIRAAAKEFALLLTEQCPACRERDAAIYHIEGAVFWANASIARHE